ncbi:MAG: sensor histidine kinase [Alkalispirochaeta sp.]
MNRMHLNPTILLLALVFIVLSVSTTVIWNLVSANHDLWKVYVAVTYLGGATDSAHRLEHEEVVRRFLESRTFSHIVSETGDPGLASVRPDTLSDPVGLSVMADRLDGYIHRQISMTEVLIVLLVVVTAVMLILLIYAGRHVVRRVRTSEGGWRLSHAVADTQEIERQRIGRELHDNIGRLLSPVRMELLGGSIDSAQRTLDTTLLELHGLTRQPATPTESAGALEFELEDLGRRLSETSGLSVDVHVTGVRQADTGVARQVYRIAQELVTNGIEHAAASRISLHVLPVHVSLVITYSDDGVGFDPDRVHRGVGLRSIQQRVELFGGTITYNNISGTRIRIELPLRSDEEPYR